MMEVLLVMVAKSVSLDLEDLMQIEEMIRNGESKNLSQFVRTAIKKELKGE
jgi:Arc/MetJ-type ribon-helix-helix transcriptional regulator